MRKVVANGAQNCRNPVARWDSSLGRLGDMLHDPETMFPAFDPYWDIPDWMVRDEDEFFVADDGTLIPMTGVLARRYAELIPPVQIAVPASADDPRSPSQYPPWMEVHYVPDFHPDDCDEVDGVRCTAVPRTLIDCAEVMTEDELRDLFENVYVQGRFDPVEFAAARARVEWRPSLELVDSVAADYLALCA